MGKQLLFIELKVKFAKLESIVNFTFNFYWEKPKAVTFVRKYRDKIKIKNIFRANDKIVNSLETSYNMKYIYSILYSVPCVDYYIKRLLTCIAFKENSILIATKITIL